MLLSFFFFKQKTAYEMRISDWSSDVCSSDLQGIVHGLHGYRQSRGQGGVVHAFGHGQHPPPIGDGVLGKSAAARSHDTLSHMDMSRNVRARRIHQASPFQAQNRARSPRIAVAAAFAPVQASTIQRPSTPKETRGGNEW